ncbi:hypothetical protein ENUP19_0121G0218 [Entamoeba nuttalli]|uniref:Regulator of g protein signaling domain containing protein n=2 Tax=Entamoeba nuttalli TaxID=412467 RepID=K2HNP1_ENTNP|nr:regulator of g protein signaling domain containing protein [Entamoeba nuttalli P19]EKE37480.1 regulator of g protein signaling domain containing protein [Entamoeba nuttalli P19]|eukprot:XP_008860184.1 regulator of g protein signaling domain containing protein [Entamoeba nuttalli P19]
MLPKVFEKGSRLLKVDTETPITSDYKQLSESHRKSVISILSEMKNLVGKLKESINCIQLINNELATMYSSGSSIIQVEVKSFIDSTEGLSMKSLPMLENEIECCETYYKDLSKKFSHYRSNNYQDYYEQRFDVIDPCILLYMKLVIGLTGEKIGSFKKLLYDAVQDGLSIHKSYTLLASFKSICENRVGSLYLEKCLTDIGEERNIQFFRQAMLYNNITSPDVKEWVAKDIYETFICTGSNKELQISQAIKKDITNNYAEAKYENLFNEAKNDIFELMERKDFFDLFKQSSYFKDLTHRLTALDDKQLLSKDIEMALKSSMNDEIYVDVAKYLIPYNLVGFTDEFVTCGYTAPTLMGIISDKEIQRFATNSADVKRLQEFCQLAQNSMIEKSKTLTKEAITKVRSIQNNFIKYVESNNENVKNTLSFIEYIQTTPEDKMTISQILSRSEMAFIELKAKHHVAYRLLKKCDSVQEMQPILIQCQNALISILVDEHLEEYNKSLFWKPQFKKTPKRSERSSRSKMSRTPDLVQLNTSFSPSRRAFTPRVDRMEVLPSPRNLEEGSKRGKLLACISQSENDLRLTLEHYSKTFNQPEKQENKIEEISEFIKNNIQPKLTLMKENLCSIKSNEEYDKYKPTIEMLDNYISFIGDEIIYPQKPKIFIVKTNDLTLKDVLINNLNKLDTIEVSLNCILQKLSSLATNLRKGSTTIMKYANMIQHFSMSF